MKYIKKISTVLCAAALGIATMTSCEGGDIISVNSPSWLQEKIDSIAAANKDEELVGMNEDVYTVGETDFSSGWYTAFSKYYQVEDNQKWNAVFNLSINPSAPNTFKNFALFITNDEDRGANKEYGAIRYDYQPSGNSEWGDHITRKYATSNLTFATDTDKGIEKLGGKVTLTVDRSKVDTFLVKITNGTVTKTYIQPKALENLNADASNTKIRCFLVPEGSYINFLESNVEPIGGYTSAADKAPVSMVLHNVPTELDKGADLNEAMAGVSATVTFEEDLTKEIPASELNFSAINDMDVVGENILVVIYNKTFKGENAATPIIDTNAKFNVVSGIKSISVTTMPTRTTYYFYKSAALNGVEHTLAFDPTGMVVTAKYVEGDDAVVDNSKLKFSSVPATVGEHEVTITTENGRTAIVKVNVEESNPVNFTMTPTTLGNTNNTTKWLDQTYTDFKNVSVGQTAVVKFINYSDLAANWDNFLAVLRSGTVEQTVVRADNYGWGAGYDACTKSGEQADWAKWLAAMNGAKVTAYITNCGNGTVDALFIMSGSDKNTYYQYYLGLNNFDSNDVKLGFSVDGSHLVFQ